jgi:putative ABC transport system permease protein
VVDLKQQLNGDAPRLIVILTAAIAAVLLIACTNVASLLTVRASLRGSELAVRTAIGATTRRLRRQLLVEQLLLAAAGGALAIVIAVPLHQVLVEQRLLSLPKTAATVGWPAFAALGAAVLVIGSLLARVSARRLGGAGAAALLLHAARQTGAPAQLRLRQGLVILEVGAALMLVVVAGLMMRSAARLANVDPGFATDNVLTFGVVMPPAVYNEPALRVQFVTRVVEKLRQVPGVRAASSAGYAPMGQMRATRRFAPEDRPRPAPGAEPLAVDLPVGPGYFEVMAIPLIHGRTFDERDGATAPPVLIVSETFARDVFPGENAIGKRIGFYSARPGAPPPPSREIVGVVSDVRQDGITRRPLPQMYAPYAQAAWGFSSFFVRVNGDATGVAAALPRVVSSIDPMRPVRDIKSTGQIVRGSMARQRAMTGMLSTLAAIALLLAAVGLYGVSATAAASRSRELAIRAAVGADRSMLMRLILGQGLVTSLIGVALGAAGSLAATRGLGAFLYETPARDPATFVATAILLIVVAAAATYIPARRALAHNPADVLRAEG